MFSQSQLVFYTQGEPYATYPSSYTSTSDAIDPSPQSSSSSDELNSSNPNESDSHKNKARSTNPPERRIIRSHRKTRQGCFNCKRRKVKCSEERPACLPCTRNGLRCVYPLTRELNQDGMLSQLAPPQAQSMKELHSGRLEYTALDMRLLHHFLFEAYPHLPLDCDAIWTREIPALAHQFNYLMHAMLAVSASHLVRCGQSDLAPAAYFHRLRAIEGVNEALNKPDRSVDEDDVLVSACYSLAFQNAHIGNDPNGFWITVRSIAVIGIELSKKRRFTRFEKGITVKNHAQHMTARLKCVRNVRKDLVFEALDALQEIQHLCEDPLQKEIYDILCRTWNAFLRSPLEGYFTLASIYGLVATMDPESFARMCNPSEHVLRILQCKFQAMQTLLGPILMNEWKGRPSETETNANAKGDNKTASSRWSETLCTLPAKHPWRQYLRWTESIQSRSESGELWVDYFEEEGQPTELEESLDCRAAKAEWAERLGFPGAERDAEDVVQEYEERLEEYGRRFLSGEKQSEGNPIDEKWHAASVPLTENDRQQALKWG